MMDSPVGVAAWIIEKNVNVVGQILKMDDIGKRLQHFIRYFIIKYNDL